MLDMRTIVYIYALSNAICTAVIGLLWHQNRKRFAGLGFWLADFSMQFSAVLLIALHGSLPDIASIMVSNTLAIAGTILLYMGLERFLKRRHTQAHNYVLLAVFIGIHAYFTLVRPSLLIRTLIQSAGLIFIYTQGAWLMLHRVKASLRAATRGVGYVFITFCLIACAHMIVDLIIQPGDDFFHAGGFEIGFVLMYQMMFIVLTFALFLMVNRCLFSYLEGDLLQRIRSEADLRLAQEQVIEQQRTVAAFEERQRMARNLHDSVNQSIHSLVLFSETLISVLEKNRLERGMEIAARLQESARQALKETRLMLYETQSTAAERTIDLVQDLEARLATVENRAGVRGQVILEGAIENCPEEWGENLFWIAIEALNNALKHAQARSVQITIRCLAQRIELEVTDNGKGFNPLNKRTGGLGLRSMRQRASLMGGELLVDSTPGKGSRVWFAAEIKE